MPTPRSRTADLALIALFAAILVAPVLCQVAGLDIRGTPEDEKRVPRPFPKLAATAQGIREFPRGFDAWFTDHFGLRRLLIRTHSALLYFGLNSTPAPKVRVPRSGASTCAILAGPIRLEQIRMVTNAAITNSKYL